MERKAIFDAALMLIKEGRFQSTPMSEIAYYAKLAESTTLYFFESREKLLTDLNQYIYDILHGIISKANKEGASFEVRFFSIWRALYEYYARNPAAMAFVEQSSKISGIGKERKVSKPFNKQLIEFFKAESPDMMEGIRPETLATVFHGNIMIAARMHSDYYLIQREDELKNLVQILWDGIASAMAISRRD